MLVLVDFQLPNDERQMQLLKPWIVDLSPLRADFDDANTFADIQCYFDDGNKPASYYWGKSSFLLDIDTEIAEKILKHFQTAPPSGSTIEIMRLGLFPIYI